MRNVPIQETSSARCSTSPHFHGQAQEDDQKRIQDAPILVLGSEHVIDIEDIVALLVIEAVVLRRLARLGQDPPRVPRRLVRERRVDEVVRLGKRDRQGLEGLREEGGGRGYCELRGLLQALASQQRASDGGSSCTQEIQREERQTHADPTPIRIRPPLSRLSPFGRPARLEFLDPDPVPSAVPPSSNHALQPLFLLLLLLLLWCRR